MLPHDLDTWRCSQVLLGFFRSLDEDDAEGVVRAFAADGVWHRRGERFEGHAALRAAMAARPADRVVRHVVTNLVVTPGADGRLSGASYMMAYAATRPAVGGVAELGAPAALQGCATEFRLEAGAWRIASHRAVPLLRASGAGH
jgi:hypothetical protein